MSSGIPAIPEFGDVVVGVVDGSPSARTAVFWAAAEADRRRRFLCRVHAADTDRRAYWTDAETAKAVWEAGRDLLTRTAAAVHDTFPGSTSPSGSADRNPSPVSWRSQAGTGRAWSAAEVSEVSPLSCSARSVSASRLAPKSR